MKNGISRRSFLTGTGAAVGGLAAGSILGYNATAQAATVRNYPWPASTTKAELKQKAFSGYMAAGCCYGAAKGLLDQAINDLPLEADKDAWRYFNQDMFRFGGGGVAGWGTICGALNGALFVMNMAVGSDGKFAAAVDELMSWYCQANFPDTSDADIAAWMTSHYTGYTFVDPITGVTSNPNLSFAGINQSISYSPLCHASVSRWVEANAPADRSGDLNSSAGMVNGLAKKIRCATVTAQTAVKAAQIIEAIKAATYTPTVGNGADATNGWVANWVYAKADDDCIACHNAAGPASTRNDEQGKMNCNECHAPSSKDPADYVTAVDPFKNKADSCKR